LKDRHKKREEKQKKRTMEEMFSAQLNINKKKSLRSMTDCMSEKRSIEKVSKLKRFELSGHLVKWTFGKITKCPSK
jgi:hypothetical protein